MAAYVNGNRLLQSILCLRDVYYRPNSFFKKYIDYQRYYFHSVHIFGKEHRE